MRYVAFLAATLALGAHVLSIGPSQSIESPQFNVLEALRDEGVNTDELPIGLLSRSPTSGCAAACASLNLLYQPDVLQDNVTACSEFNSAYWSNQQAEAQPHCKFKAPHAASISTALLIARLYRCPFAVKSGGHAAFPGASNINDGITISLEKLNTIELSSDRNTVAIGAGMRWGQIYKSLSQTDLAVIGGRVASIGVGGLTTGGGISFLSNLHGWACDNVLSYEVVLASGKRVTASQTKNSDLYWSLRGGGNNFGIVTKFHLETHPLPGHDMWGGSRIYTEDSFPALTNAFHNLIANSASDPKAGQWIAWLVSNGTTELASTEFWYAGPNGSSAPIFAEYNDLRPIMDTTTNTKLAYYTETLDKVNPYGMRETYYGLTLKALNPSILHMARDIFYAEVPSIAHIPGVAPVLLFQGITTGQLAGMSKRGGNPLGLKADQPLYLIHLSNWWASADDDEEMYAFTTRVLRRIEAAAREQGVDNEYVYMNYAGMYQDVVRGYGRDNQGRLREVSRRYDPQGVMQKLQPGYFKLWGGAPVDGGGRYF